MATRLEQCLQDLRVGCRILTRSPGISQTFGSDRGLLFEETVVDRYGLWEYMPYYRVGKLCSWDIGAMVLIGWLVWRMLGSHRRRVDLA
jgi:hypothetical protein